MEVSPEDVAAAFAHHEFAVAYPYLSDEVTWSLVGGKRLAGSSAVKSHCDESSVYLKAVITAFVGFTVIRASEYVIVESEATYTEPSGSVSAVASCDVFRFRAGRIWSIVSYNIELPPPGL